MSKIELLEDRRLLSLTLPATGPGTVAKPENPRLGLLALGKHTAVAGSLGGSDHNDVFTFTLSQPTQVTIGLSGLSQNADLYLNRADRTHQLLGTSTAKGTAADSIVQSLDAGTYSITVASVDYSTTAYALQLATMRIAAPSRLEADVWGGNSVHLNWNDNTTGETGFLIQRYTHAGWRNVETVPAGSTAAVVDGLVPGASTTYRIEAIGVPMPAVSGQRSTMSLSGVSILSTNTVMATTETEDTSGWYKVSIALSMTHGFADWNEAGAGDGLSVRPEDVDQWIQASSWQDAVWKAISGQAQVVVTGHSDPHYSWGQVVTHNFPNGGDFKVGTGAELAADNGVSGFELPHTTTDGGADTKYIALEDSYGYIDRDYDDFYWKVNTEFFSNRVNITGPSELWYFGGENAANYDESASFSYTSKDDGIEVWPDIEWNILGKTDAAELSHSGATNGDSISLNLDSGDSRDVTMTSTGTSAQHDDVTLQLMIHGELAAMKTITIKAPVAKTTGYSDTDYPAGSHHFKTVYTMEVDDQFDQAIPRALEINESFSAATNIVSNNWPVGVPNGTTTYAINGSTPSYFADDYEVNENGDTSMTPRVLTPNEAGASEVVRAQTQTYRAGSTTSGEGIIIK